MKRLLNTFIASALTSAGALALVAVLMPTEASAQHYYTSGSHYSSHSGRGYAPPQRVVRQRTPVCRTPVRTSPRVIFHPHYTTGSIYYRSPSYGYGYSTSHRYCAPQVVVPRRQVIRSRSYCR